MEIILCILTVILCGLGLGLFTLLIVALLREDDEFHVKRKDNIHKQDSFDSD